jgi:CoA:oxalate CoA-transferase
MTMTSSLSAAGGRGVQGHMTVLPRPLEGLRVLDLSRAVSGPFAGRILGDLGADVVKVEPPAGDLTDAFGAVQAGRAGLYAQMNVGKRNVQLDLAREEDLALARGMASVADVVIENYRPGVLDRLGLGWSWLVGVNPTAVLLSISGFGAHGPESTRRAYASVVHAESGLLARQARSDRRAPTDITFSVADTLASLHGVIAVQAALTLRQRTGTGQHIDLSMLEAMVASDDYVHEVLDGVTGPGNRGTMWDGVGGPVLLAADVRAAWALLRHRAALADGLDPGASLEEKIAARRAAVTAWLTSFPTRSGMLAALDDAGIAASDLRAPEDLLAEPSLVAAPPWTAVDDGGGGTRRVVRMPYRFSAASAAVVGRVAPPDADRAAVTQDWLARGKL